MNNKIFAARKPTSLVRVWHSTGDPRMPLACIWGSTDTTVLRPNPADSSSDESGGFPLCA